MLMNSKNFSLLLKGQYKFLLVAKFEPFVIDVNSVIIKDTQNIILQKSNINDMMKKLDEDSNNNYYDFVDNKLYLLVKKEYYPLLEDDPQYSVIISVTRTPKPLSKDDTEIDLPLDKLEHFTKYLIVEAAKLKGKPIPQEILNDLLNLEFK